MRLRVISTVLGAIVALPLLASAQSAPSAPSSQGELRQDLLHKRYIVLPKPPIDTVKQDAQDAAEKVAAPQRQADAVNESRRRTLNRPDLDHDVVQGIQARQIDKARR